jgi:CTP:molybdopterin cytidylyltransferase MocA
MPHVSPDTVARLLAALDDETEASWLTGPDGRRQLAGALTPSLVPGPAEAHGAPMHLLMSAGTTRDVPAVGPEADDIDTVEDLARLRP